jgi:hypothetical protein
MVNSFYLSAWLDPVTPAGQQRALWKFAKDGTGKHRRSPKKTLVESDRYTVQLKNGERDLGSRETEAATRLRDRFPRMHLCRRER